MDPLQLKKQTAKQLFKNKRFAECKKLLLDIVSEGNGHYKALMTLGNVCTELGQYENAKKYYQQSINENPRYPMVYCKFAILLSEYLNDCAFAEKMFEISTRLDPKNSDVCWLNYGKLMYKIRNFNKSKQCYLKCVKQTALLNYYFAKLLLITSDSNINVIEKAKLKLEKATQIKPNNAKYHYEYALCLQLLKKYNSSNAQFILALQLSNMQNIQMLYDYSNLLSIHFHNYEQAINYLKVAIDLDKNNDNEYAHIKKRFIQLNNWLEQSSKQSAQHEHKYELKQETDCEEQLAIEAAIEYDSDIKLLIYTFDENITYWNVNDINDLQSMSTLDTIINIFGGTDRLQKLQQHFQRIRSLKNSQNIQLVILSNNSPEMVRGILEKVGIGKYFFNANIINISMDTSFDLQKHIVMVCKKYKLNISNEILYIDSIIENINSIKKKCKTYHVTSEHLLNGLSLKHMYQIETIIGVENKNEMFYDFVINNDENSKDLRDTNPSIYDAIKREIIKKQSLDSIYSLPVIKYINDNWDDNSEKDKFIYFAQQYKLIRRCRPKAHFWRASNILPQLMKLSPNDSEFPGRYAACLAFLQHYESADYYFQMAISQQPISINYHLYGYFLFNREKYCEAEINFLKAIELSNDRYYSRSCLGLGRTLEYLNKPTAAEKYYLKAIKCSYETGKMEYFYGIFLFNHRRFQEAKKQFQIAVNYYPNISTNHYWLSKTFVELNDFKKANYHSKQACKLDPNFNETRMEFTKYHYDFDDAGRNDENYCSNSFKKKRRGNPLMDYSEPVESLKMEKFRKEMEIIAKNEYEVCLDQMNEIYYNYFNYSLREKYDGKMKNLGMYFNDIFELKWYPKINQLYLISKIYKKYQKRGNVMFTTKQNGNEIGNKRSSGNPLIGYSETIDGTEMEKHRNEMEIIAANESTVVLDQLHLTYYKYFHKRFKSVYYGKAKNLAMYFNDLFELEWNANNNVTYLYSKIYKQSKNESKWTPKKNGKHKT